MRSQTDKIAALAFDPAAPEGEAIAAFLKLRSRGVKPDEVDRHIKEGGDGVITTKVPASLLQKFVGKVVESICQPYTMEVSDTKVIVQVSPDRDGTVRAILKKIVEEMKPKQTTFYGHTYNKAKNDFYEELLRQMMRDIHRNDPFTKKKDFGDFDDYFDYGKRSDYDDPPF